MKVRLLISFIMFSSAAIAQLPIVCFPVTAKPPYNLNEYIGKHLHYPTSAKTHGIQGKVIAQFTVNTNGKISGCKIIKGLDKNCDDEVLKLINSMPRWMPVVENGKPIKTLYTLPVNFKLDE